MVTNTKEESVKFQTIAEENEKNRIVSRVISSWDQLNIAFVHQQTPDDSAWVLDHEMGKKHIEEVFGEKIKVRSYYGVSTPEQAEFIIQQAV